MDDFSNPDWANAKKVHDWKNYISEEVENIWFSFTEEQKKLIAEQAHETAMMEEWD